MEKEENDAKIMAIAKAKLKHDTYEYYLRSKNFDSAEYYERMRQNTNTEIIVATTLLIVLGAFFEKPDLLFKVPIIIFENIILILSITLSLISTNISQKSGEISLKMLDSWLETTNTRIDNGLDRLKPEKEEKLNFLAYCLGVISTTLIIISLIIFSIISVSQPKPKTPQATTIPSLQQCLV